jgi:CubicO group peptidase (beta-lactamase class C family)
MDNSKQCEQQTANAEGYEVVITGLEQQARSREGKCLLGPLLLKGQCSIHGQSCHLRFSVSLGLAVMLTVSNLFSSSRSRHFRASFFPRSPRRSKAHVYRVMVTCGLLSFLALSLHPFPALAFSQTPPPDFAGIDRYVTAQMQEAHIPGLALGIVHGDHLVHLRGFGVANPAGQPVTPQTPFILGSLSKSFTAVAIMQLIDAGKMELDAPVQHYLPWFRVADRNASAQMRVYHLLHQTSGLPTTAGAEAMAGTGQASLEQRVRELSTVVLTQPVGTIFQYSNANYLVLGLLVQVVSGQSYGAYIQQHIFAPLQMHHSFVSLADATQHGMATGYRWWFGVPLPASLPYLSDQLPAAFLISSAEDMTQYLMAHITNGSYQRTPVLAGWAMSELHQASALVSSKNGGLYYGMGWFIGATGGVPTIAHDGCTANFRTEMVMVPSQDWGIVILVNAYGFIALATALDQMTQGVTSLLMGHQPPPEMISFSLFYSNIDLAILLLSVLQMWLLVKVFCWRKRVEHLKRQPGVLLAQALLLVTWEIVVPLLLVIGLPFLFNTPWPVMLLYQPDIISWLVGMMLLSTGTGLTKTLLAILACRKRQDQRRPVLQAIRLAEGVATRRNDESRKEATAVGLSVRARSP